MDDIKEIKEEEIKPIIEEEKSKEVKEELIKLPSWSIDVPLEIKRGNK